MDILNIDISGTLILTITFMKKSSYSTSYRLLGLDLGKNKHDPDYHQSATLSIPYSNESQCVFSHVEMSATSEFRFQNK